MILFICSTIDWRNYDLSGWEWCKLGLLVLILDRDDGVVMNTSLLIGPHGCDFDEKMYASRTRLD